MGVIVAAGASLACTFGSASASLNVTSQTAVLTEGKLAATIQDIAPMVNIAPFGLCSSMANPQVAAATAAALGALTPQPCVPAVVGAWTSTRPSCLVEGKPCLTNDATAVCAYGGSLSVVSPGQGKAAV